MGIQKVSGNILQDNLQRGANLSIQGNLAYFNVTNSRVGIRTSNTTHVLTVSGNGKIDGVSFTGNSISAQSGLLEVGSNANIQITGGSSGYLLTTDGTGNLFWTDSGNIANLLGNTIDLGTPSQGNLQSNAVTLTESTTVTDGIALLNVVLGKLVPPAPSNFPGGQSLTISSLSTYRMANIVQTNNTANGYAVSAGATVTNARRAATYSTNTIATVGPGDSGTLTLFRNGTNIANVAFNLGASPTANGTYNSNLVITNNMDYNSANANIAAGFWYVFSAAVSGSNAPAGWNDIKLSDSVAGNTSTVSWYYDNSSPSTPSFSSTTFSETANALAYSSTVPHYTTSTQFTLNTTVANASGNMYPTSNVLASGSAGGSFAAPASVNYNASNVGSNILNSFQTASFSTTAAITTGFGASSTGPSVAVNNSYATGTLTLTTALGNTVLRKTGSATAIDEGNIVVTSVGTGSGNAVRIVNPGNANTPTYTASATTFNSQNGPLQTYDAVVAGSSSQGLLSHNQTNYSTGYLPAGPNLSAGRSGTQYFTFKFVRTDVSKFDITYAGNVAGMWVALPGSVIDSSSSANGWIDMTVAYAGAGYPGVNAPGNGSNGCSLGGVVVPNVNTSSVSKTCTFGTVSSSSTLTNEIYIRLALTSGQSVTGLSLKAASN